MTTIVISCILSINGKKKVQPAAGKMGHTLLSCKTGREQFQQQYFFLSSYLDCSFRKDALESLFFPTSSKYMCICSACIYLHTKKLQYIFPWELFNTGSDPELIFNLPRWLLYSKKKQNHRKSLWNPFHLIGSC